MYLGFLVFNHDVLNKLVFCIMQHFSLCLNKQLNLSKYNWLYGVLPYTSYSRIGIHRVGFLIQIVLVSGTCFHCFIFLRDLFQLFGIHYQSCYRLRDHDIRITELRNKSTTHRGDAKLDIVPKSKLKDSIQILSKDLNTWFDSTIYNWNNLLSLGDVNLMIMRLRNLQQKSMTQTWKS